MRTVKKKIYLPAALAHAAKEMARAEGKTLSAVIQEALRAARAARLKAELGNLQDYWSRNVKARGILTERELERYLRQ